MPRMMLSRKAGQTFGAGGACIEIISIKASRVLIAVTAPADVIIQHDCSKEKESHYGHRRSIPDLAAGINTTEPS